MDQQRYFIGPFELIKPIGHGSMGVVWEGLHHAQDTHVAIKVITASGSEDETFQQAFTNEVRAVARLHHPSIIRTLDYGMTTQAIPDGNGDEIAAGSQYYAMELATGGVLPRPKTPLAWSRTRFLLLEILDALAHAHARDVIHRDIKPANIMLAQANDHMRIKLTDFGIAKAVGSKDLPDGVVAGTPRYMAPEQILNQTRDQGPWTDLYSVGCLAYQFATGKRIFDEFSGNSVLRAQITEQPARIVGKHVPEGFQDWLDKMLAKHITNRYQFAAEAAWDLVNLPEPEIADPNEFGDLMNESIFPGAERSEVNEVCAAGDSNVFTDICSNAMTIATVAADLSDELLNDTGDTQRMDSQEIAAVIAHNGMLTQPTTTHLIDDHLATLAEMFNNIRNDEMVNGRLVSRIPAPKSWQREQESESDLQLNGAGLGLWGLRTIPMVDRNIERSAIYDTLLQMRRDHRARTIILDGPQGTGKSRIVEWMSQRAHELALAHTIKAFHYADHYNSTGVARAMMYHIACQGLPRHEALGRIRGFLADHPLPHEFDDALPMLELMHLENAKDHLVPGIHFNSSEEKYTVLKRFLLRLSSDRPTVLWLDDFHLSTFSLEFVRYIMQHAAEDELPVLILCTARHEELDKTSAQYESWRRLVALPNVTTYMVMPLPPKSHLELVHELIGLDDDLCSKVAERTSGMPLFAIQLVGDWIERGVLVPGPSGFRLKEGTCENLPDSLHEVWLSRLRIILSALKDHTQNTAWEQLEIAACLGNQFDADEWRIACEMADLGDTKKTREVMEQHRLFEVRYPNIRFVHTLLRESLIRYAEENERARQHHLICADMLRDYFSDTFEFYHERRAEHLFAAKVWESCLEPLLQAAIVRRTRGEYALAHELLKRREQALNACKADEDSPIRAYGWVAEANCYILEGRFDDANALIENALQLGNKIQSSLVLALAYKERGQIMQYRNQLPEALESLKQSLHFFSQISPRRREAHEKTYAEVYNNLGRIYDVRHEQQEARGYLEKAIEIQTRTGDTYGLGRSYNAMGNLLSHSRLYADAAASLDYARQIFESLGARLDHAHVLNDLGEVYRNGYMQYDAAENHYRRAIDLYREINVPDGCTTIINLVLLLLAKQRYNEAKQIVLNQIRIQETNQQTFDCNWLYAELLVCCAATFDWPTFNNTVLRLGQSLEISGVVDNDILYCTEQATLLCLKYSSRDQARFCLEIAMQQAIALHDQAAIQRLQKL